VAGIATYISPSTGNATIVNYSLLNNAFNNISNASVALGMGFGSGGAINDLNVSQNSFDNISDSSAALNYQTDNAGLIVTSEITNNTFSGPSATSAGYATNITIDNGSTCLTFTNNLANPVNSPDPYTFTQANGATFNTSNVTGNVGQIDTAGTIGSC
jgi:hypothetical protein